MITACMLVKDEASTLERAVRSVAGLAEELIIGVDSASTDGTRGIANSFADTVLDIDFRGDFSAAHNQIARLATQPWLLTGLSAQDDRLSPCLTA